MGSSSTGELKAILFGLKSLARHKQLAHIKILRENSTAVVCTNRFGTSHSGKCDTLSKQIWKWEQEYENWLSATHIREYKTQRQNLNLERMRSIPSGNSGKIYLTTYAHN